MKKVRKMAAGDTLLFYVKQEKEDGHIVGSSIVGAYKTVSEPYKSRKKLFASASSKAYPFLVNIETFVLPEKPLDFKIVVPRLSFIKHKRHWGCYLQRAMLKLTEDEAAFVISQLRQRT
jgi:predicted RNA-binding protein